MEEDEERHTHLVNPQLSDPPSVSEARLVRANAASSGEQLALKQKAASVCAAAKVSVCIKSYKLERLPKGKAKSALCSAGDNEHHCNKSNCYIIIPSEYYGFMFY